MVTVGGCFLVAVQVVRVCGGFLVAVKVVIVDEVEKKDEKERKEGLV